MRKFPLAFSAILGMLLTLATGAASQTFPPGLPIAITCYAQHDQSWTLGYLSSIRANGDALYMSVNGRLSATVNSKGIVVMPADRPGRLDCYGKTLDELRANGRVLDFQRAR